MLKGSSRTAHWARQMRVWVMKGREKLEKDGEEERKGTRGHFHCVLKTNNSSQGQLSALKMRKVEVKRNHDGS